MPRFFDDYSNTYLTHDSAAGRKQQRRGWKFRENFKVCRLYIFGLIQFECTLILHLLNNISPPSTAHHSCITKRTWENGGLGRWDWLRPSRHS